MANTAGQRITPEELANSLTHGTGLALSVAALAVLVVAAALHGSVWHIVSFSVYGATLVCLYGASTLYHSVMSPPLKRVFKVVDHSAIYMLIAGTYTAFTLVNLRGSWGWSLFGAVWGLSLLGIVLKVFFVDLFEIASTAVYLGMGWLVVIAHKPLFALVPHGGLVWLVAGGLAYTVGVAFYAWRSLRFHHAIWHVFVLLGSICHFFAVLYYVLPVKA